MDLKIFSRCLSLTAGTTFEEVTRNDEDIYNAPLSIKELHEFLTVEARDPGTESYELKAVYA